MKKENIQQRQTQSTVPAVTQGKQQTWKMLKQVQDDFKMKQCVEDPRQHSSGMTLNGITTRGFTLLELLVVVLIIGVLAAVALPQYQKAVVKARFTEAITILNAIKKAKDVCKLAGKNHCSEPGNWDIEIPGIRDENTGIVTPFFHFTGMDADMGLPGPNVGYLKEKVCICYYDGTEDGTGENAQLVLSQGEGSCAGAAEPSYDYTALLNIPKAEEDTCGCC